MVMAAGTRDDAEERVTLEGIVLASPVLGPILREWSAISLPDCWLVAGAVVQTVWNDAFGFPPEHGLKDVDLVYFDDSDVSEIAEVRHAERIRRLFGGCPAAIDVKNEARVHLWYAEKFGREIAPYRSAVDAIATFPTIATAVGIRPGSSGLCVAAPYGLADLFGRVVRPNKVLISRAVYKGKLARWRPLWPGLTVIEW
jgi:hypothetical protein